MGAYLSQPQTDTCSEDGEGNKLKFGASCMQGWRITQEDAHNCELNFDEKSSLFAVYDGHGGAEVAIFMSRHFPDFLKNTESYKKGELKESLHEGFLKIDEYLKSDDGLAEVQSIAQAAKNDKGPANTTVDDENVSELYEEATMPIELLVAKYRQQLASVINRKNTGGDENEKPCSSKKVFVPAEVSDQPGPSSSSKSKTQTAIPVVEEPESQKVSDTKAKTQEQTEVTDVQITEVLEESSAADKVVSVPGQNGVSHHTEETEDQGKDQKQVINGANGDGEVEKREESVLETPVKPRKGKVHPPIPVSTPEKEKTYSTRLKDGKIYKDFVNSESGTSDSEDEDEPYVGVEPNSDDSDDAESVGDSEDTSEADEDEDEDENSLENDSEEEEDDDDDEEDLLSDVQEPAFDSGSTAVVAFCKWQDTGLLDLWVANAGDSRCTISRGGIAFDMSHDHKPEDELEARRIVAAGGKVTMDGRVNGGLNLSRAIGDHSYKQNTSLPPEDQMITPVPDVQHATLDPATDQFIVLACDGVWNSLSSQEVVDFVAGRLKTDCALSSICEELFKMCLASDTSGDGTGCDNMTAVIIKLDSSSDRNSTGKRCRNEGEDLPGDDNADSKKARIVSDGDGEIVEG